MYYWNELEMNTNVFTSSYVFISSLGLTPYYNMVFLIVKRGRVDVSIINGSQGSQHSLTFIRTRTFFLYRLKKSPSSLYIKFTWHFLLCIRNRILTPNPINIISFCVKIRIGLPYRSWGYMIDWVWVGWTLSYGKYDQVNSL